MVSLTIIGCIVPYNDPELLNGSSSSDANASPFVIAVKNAKISAVPSIMNSVILIAVLSVGNSSIYGSSRTLAALADRGQAPAILGYIDQTGRPLVAIIFASVIGLLCFIVAGSTSTRTEAFNWMLAISGLSSIVTWASINACHIRFRQAWKYNGHTLDELAFKSQPGVYGSYVGLAFNILILIAQFWTGFAPIGYADLSGGERVKSWFEAYLSAPIIVSCSARGVPPPEGFSSSPTLLHLEMLTKPQLLFFIIFKLVKKTKFKKIAEIDITSGRREMDLSEVLAEERAEKAGWPFWKRWWKTLC